MSQEHVEMVRRAYERLNESDHEGLADLCSEDFLMDMSERVFNPDTYRGRDGISRFVNDVREAWDSYRWDMEEALTAGDAVVALVHCEGHGRAGGPRVDWRVAWLWKVRQDKLVFVRFYRDRAKALEAAGLSA